MWNYYDDYYEEPSEFEMQIEEFKDSLRNSVKDEIKQKIESLEKELESLKEFKNERNKFIYEYETKVREANREADKAKREAKESEEKWKKARLHQLLGDYLTVGWAVGCSYEYGEKCDKCDDNRRIHFTSPQGKEYSEDCNCAKRYYKYFPKEATLTRFYVKTKNFCWNDADYYNRYYTVKSNNDYDEYEKIDKVYTSSDIDFENVNSWNTVFLNEEDCQKYCNWKNEQELKKMTGDKE